MRKALICSLLVCGFTTANVFASDLTLMGEYKRHDLRVANVCIEGHVVVVAHSDVGKGGGLHMMQLKHEVDGRIVPMKCTPPVSGKSGKKSRRR